METLTYPHQEVIAFYGLENKDMGAENNERLKKLNEKISDPELSSEEMQNALKESRLLAGVLVQRFSNVDDNDVRNYKQEQQNIKEVKQKIEDATSEIREEIKLLKEEEKLQEQEEEEVEEIVAPSDNNSKIQAIIQYFEENSEADESDLSYLGLKNVQGASEIILIPDKYKLVKKDNGNYVLKKKSDGILGWVLFGLGAIVAGFFGYKYLKKNN